METRTIECVAFFYHEGAKRDDFIQKNKFGCCVDSSQWGSVVACGEATRARSLSFIFGLYMNWYKLCSSKLF